MPQQLVRLRPAKFIQDVLEPYRDRLDSFWAPEQIEEIEADHRCLLKMYREDENTRKMIEKYDTKTLFNDAWDCVPRLKRLRAFCGGLATIFPNMTSVESDFSITPDVHARSNSTGIIQEAPNVHGGPQPVA